MLTVSKKRERKIKVSDSELNDATDKIAVKILDENKWTTFFIASECLKGLINQWFDSDEIPHAVPDGFCIDSLERARHHLWEMGREIHGLPPIKGELK